MKKIEILKLIDANKTIIKNKSILSIVRDKHIVIEKKNWFPYIEDLQEEFNILSKEVEKSLDETLASENYIKDNCCNHEIRLKHYGLFTNHSKCIFCGKSIISNNCVNWEYSNNRNKYCVDLIAKYQDDEDCGYIKDGYTTEEVYEIIINILKDKQDDEEVDLVKEFKKTNLTNCDINEEHKVNENYILIISGSNKQYIDDESYLYKQGTKDGLDFMTYFSNLLNTKVELIDSSDIINDKENENRNYNLKFTHYNTTKELEKILSAQIDIPFKIIIDLTELYSYKISNNNITKESYTLKLKEMFPNSYIIRINNLSKQRLEDITKYLKTLLESTHTYAYKDNKYYYLEDNEIKSNDLDTTCSKIKKLLKK